MKHLHTLFGDKMIKAKIPSQFERYKWFSCDEGFIGIEHTALSHKEQALLSAFLTPYDEKVSLLTPEQLYWSDLLFEAPEKVIHSHHKHHSFRFTQFLIKRLFEQKIEFENALHALYSTSITVLWIDKQSGIVIETFNDPNDLTENLSDSIEVLCHDFETSIQFFEGQIHFFPSSPRLIFEREKKWFYQIKHTLEQNHVIHFTDVLPHLVLQESSEAIQNHMIHLLDLVKDDGDLLETIKVYLECNLNVSLAAKKLYMHRNSLQYRIEKFIDRTHLDIKHFTGAVSAYLAILALKNSQDGK
ncbi:helix-turn-helix domain-containing protein [Priestia megaterium]|jgi:sugar diacid utilization regulator|uniref:PucR family transcriptional regulator n=1 Tax=Priestia megaterium TaxID=1404 RepID=UPI0021AB9EA4|nr:helix-turn-helix domain-containing protein [Priestia megaterium]MCR8930147.1 helix-turn-helix domain-containing protein [Priestia megaterium]